MWSVEKMTDPCRWYTKFLSVEIFLWLVVKLVYYPIPTIPDDVKPM